MRAEQVSRRKVDAGGWPVNLTSYKLGEVFHATADNVSPGACVARAAGSTREEAENKALEDARRRLARTRRRVAPEQRA